MFLHGGWAHILGNMLFLWIFGNNVEDALGRAVPPLLRRRRPRRDRGQTFVTIHYGGAAAASVPNLGASGAIAAVLGAYIVILPRASVLTLLGFFIVPVPAFVFLGMWFVLQLWEGGFWRDAPVVGRRRRLLRARLRLRLRRRRRAAPAARSPVSPSW